MSDAWRDNGWDNSSKSWRERDRTGGSWSAGGWEANWGDRGKGDVSKGDSAGSYGKGKGRGNAEWTGKGEESRGGQAARNRQPPGPTTPETLTNTNEYRRLETDEQRVAYMITHLWPPNQRGDALPKSIRIGPVRHAYNYTLKARHLVRNLRRQFHLKSRVSQQKTAVATTEASEMPHYECNKSAKGWDADGAVLHLILVKAPDPTNCQWMALHAPPGMGSQDALNRGSPVFRSFSAVLDPTEEHMWDFFNADAGHWERLGPFETNILAG